jgi:hypothetical protein
LVRRGGFEFLLQVNRGLLVCCLQDTIHTHLISGHSQTKRDEKLINHWYGVWRRIERK